MELQALISILQFLNGAEATIYMDSEYVLFGATKWLLGWKAKDWDKVKNFDLWQAIDLLLSQANVHLLYTAGHAGEAGNELAHKLANYSRINKAQSAA